MLSGFVTGDSAKFAAAWKNRNNRKGGTASLRSRTRVKRNALFSARFKRLSLYFRYKQGNLIRINTGLDTFSIRIQTGTPLSQYPPLVIVLKKRDPHKLFQGDFYVKNGVPNRPFSATESLAY